MNFIRGLVAAAAVTLFAVGTAQAGQVGGNYHDYGHLPDCGGGGGGSSCTNLQLTGTQTNGAVEIWNFKCAGGLSATCADALPSNPDLINSGSHKTLVYQGLYTGPINFSDNHNNTIGGFLQSGCSNLNSCFNAHISNGTKGLQLSSGFSTSRSCPTGCGKVTIMEFTFTLGSEQDLYIQHDDGISVWDSTNTNEFLDVSSPTSEITSMVTLGAGVYNLWYAEVNGLPADLITCLVPHVDNTPVPEPLTLGLFGAGLVGAVALRRRRKTGVAN